MESATTLLVLLTGSTLSRFENCHYTFKRTNQYSDLSPVFTIRLLAPILLIIKRHIWSLWVFHTETLFIPYNYF
jgi:hypothetical protein